ncbi:VOC family protein [Cyanobium sp. CH-040]|uniref:VOC family protein n=1 Tax=Cyanobium sp. CH-040 TaxID=2823708 RepID=UPI0020CC6332|nr:VOC family protein [Cyanobium sp. CH-040]MCP9927038.1 VOC family protein [Cyanobium sp. CH-040]
MLQIISQLAITCKDQEATEAWYCKNFGFRRTRVAVLPGGKKIVFLKMSDCAFYLELFQAEEELPIPEAMNDGYTFPGFRHLAFKVNDVDQKLSEIADVEITLGPLNFDDYIPGWRTVWIRDPDGRIIEISHGFQDE